MARAKTPRTLHDLPVVKGFRPMWMRTNYRQAITLNLEEYEAIRLVDYESMTQDEVAELMGVSRPTVTRIYESARKKLALALVEGRTFVIEGGSVEIAYGIYQCEECEHRVQLPTDEPMPEVCIACGSEKMISLEDCFVRGCRRWRRWR